MLNSSPTLLAQSLPWSTLVLSHRSQSLTGLYPNQAKLDWSVPVKWGLPEVILGGFERAKRSYKLSLHPVEGQLYLL